jgi:acetyl-CoA carboxylase carboxyltransferase component
MTIAAPALAQDRRITPFQRLERLCDADSVEVIRSRVRSARLGPKGPPGDGVVGASGRVAGRHVFCYAEDSRFAGGSLGAAHAETIVRVLTLARRARVPVIGLIESAGARVQEGLDALGGYARIFRENVALSGLVPQISVLTGVSAGGGCYSPALTDFVIMSESAAMFLTGPAVVREAVGEDVTLEELGGSGVHTRNGVCHFVSRTHLDAIDLARDLLSYLPQSAGQAPPRAAPEPPEHDDPGAWLPAESQRVYDVRDVIRSIVDAASVLEVAPKWAANIVTALARIEGRPVGIVANQPRRLGGVLDAAAAQKAARFVRTCNSFGLPLVALVDTPGFLPGTKQECGGVIRHGAKLVHAFAEATVPKVSIVLRKAYGGAYISMNAKDLGADFAFAWPGAELGIMAARQAVQLVHRRELEHADEHKCEELAARYAETHLSAHVALRTGYLDEMIEPAETRQRLAAAFRALAALITDRDANAPNIPL